MGFQKTAAFACLLLISVSALSQVAPRDVNAARNIRGQGTSLDTNVTFSLSLTRQGESTLIDSAEVGDTVSISVVMRPEEEDIGKPAEIILVDANPAKGFLMRNGDGNFVAWDGKVPNLVSYLTDTPLEAEMNVEVFSGQLGETGTHRVFVGFLVDGDTLYFTPQALKFDIVEPAQPSARDQAIAFFESTISPTIVQSICIACHVNGGAAFGLATHIFVRTSDPDHLTKNFAEFEKVHDLRGTQYILDKVRGLRSHGGGTVIFNGSTGFNNLQDFLELLDEAAAEPGLGSNDPGVTETDSTTPPVPAGEDYGDYAYPPP